LSSELRPGKVGCYVVVRVSDEFTVDLMAKACGLLQRREGPDYHWHRGAVIPFASAKLLWKTKRTLREKDARDRMFFQRLLQEREEWSVD
jgi:hypothetical protein